MRAIGTRADRLSGPGGPGAPFPVLRSLIAFLLAGTAACAPSAGGVGDTGGSEGGPRRLAMRVAADSPLVPLLEAHPMVARLRSGDRVRFEMGPDATGDVVVEPELATRAGRLAGRLDPLPVRVEPGALVLGGRRYDRPEDVLAVRLPQPEGQHWLVVGHDPESLADFALRTLLRRGGAWWGREDEAVDYVLHESPYLARSGRWRRTGDGRFEIDPVHDDDPIARRAASWSRRAVLTGGSVRLRVAPGRDQEAMRSLLRDLDDGAAAMASRLRLALDSPVDVWVEDDYESLGRYLGAIAPAVLHDHDGTWDVHLVEHPADRFYHRYVVAQALVMRAGLAADRPWLRDGAALWLSGDWYGRGRRDWLPLLAAARVLPSAAELLAGERQEDATDVLWAPVAAGVLDRLPGGGLGEKLAAAADPEPVAAALAALADLAASAPPAPRPGGWSLPFQSGVSLAMAPGLDRGYQAAGYSAVLAHLREIGAGAVSLMPMAGQRRPDRPEMGFMRRGAGSEHDLALVEGVRRARAHGFEVLYKPHVWVGRGSWPGDIAMTSDDDWRLWWRAYRRYVLHHAVLAAFSGAEIFAVGTELGGTLGHEAEWRGLIEGVRRVYPGLVTYAGNWWGDYDRIPFADLLDAVGVDAYFPLSKDPEASDEQLAAGAREAVRRMEASARRFGKPLLLTEVGFAAQRAPWVTPHEEGRRGETVSLEDQRRAYAALLGALGRPDWLAGVYPWKVMSGEVPATGAGDPDFVFLGRPAESVVSAYLRGE